MAYENCVTTLLLLFLCWRIVASQDTAEDDQGGLHKINLIPSNRLRYSPDMRMMLNGLLRYENAVSKRPEDPSHYPFLQLANRSKGSSPPVDDPLTALATGFLGSRGKKDDYDEIPVFANGFPAGRG